MPVSSRYRGGKVGELPLTQFEVDPPQHPSSPAALTRYSRSDLAKLLSVGRVHDRGDNWVAPTPPPCAEDVADSVLVTLF